MANNRSVAVLRSGNAQIAFSIAQGTDQIFAQAGDIRRQAMALGNQAAALDAMNKSDEAIQYYQQCNELLKQGNDPSLRAYVLQSLSGLYLRRRRYLDALIVMEAALDIKEHISFREKVLKSCSRSCLGYWGDPDRCQRKPSSGSFHPRIKLIFQPDQSCGVSSIATWIGELPLDWLGSEPFVGLAATSQVGLSPGVSQG